MADYEDPPTFAVATVTVPQLNRLSENIRHLKEQADQAVVRLSTNTTTVGNVGTGEDDLMTYSLAAGVLDANGKGVRITCGGRFRDIAEARTLKLYFGGTVVFQIGFSDPGANYSWRLVAEVVRTGAATQVSFATFIGSQAGNNSGDESTRRATPGETLSGAVTIKVTGESSSSDNIQQDLMIIERF